MDKVRLFILLSLLTFLFLTPVHLASASNAKKSKQNVLLITIDTLRSDRLSCYSKQHVQTPNIDRLAEKGVLFTRAFANTSTTLPSHTNILLGTNPLYHGIHDNFHFKIREELLTLAEHLKSFGYSTGAFVGAFPLDSRFGIAQGFDTYDDDFEKNPKGERRAGIVVDKAIKWLKYQKDPWFLWVHCYDPHDPYEPPEPFLSEYGESLYEGEVAYVDYILGSLFEHLEKDNLEEETIVIFTSDHGESLGEHGEETHGFFAYNTTIWIPLIMYIPGSYNSRIDQYVSHLDIFPTVCELLAVEKPSFCQGISLLPVIKGKKLGERSLYFESLEPYYNRGWAPITGFIRETEKFIDSPLPELYDLEKDFDEAKNIAQGIDLNRYRKELSRIIETQTYTGKVDARRKLDKESYERLKSLGYISGVQTTEKKEFGAEDDVKLLLPYFNEAKNALTRFWDGFVEDGMNRIKEVIAATKKVDVAFLNLGKMYRELGRMEDAIRVLRLGLEQIPSSYEIFSYLVHFLLATQQDSEVIELFKTNTLFQMESDPDIWNWLGVAYWRTDDFENALMAYEQALEIDNENAVIFCNVGHVYFSMFLQKKDETILQKCVESYSQSLELDPNYVQAHDGLGKAHSALGNLDGAIYHWEKVLEFRPDYHATLYNLGLAYLNKGDKKGALNCFLRLKQKFFNRYPEEERQKIEELIAECRR
jgi:arylsulfatase A-like enzyme/Flp pilus assembly protein TadD